MPLGGAFVGSSCVSLRWRFKRKGDAAMIRPILSAAALSVIVFSVAWASPPFADLQLGRVMIGKNEDRNRDGIRHEWRSRETFCEGRRDYDYNSLHDSYRVFVPRRRT